MNSAVLFRLLFAVCLLGGVMSQDVAESNCRNAGCRSDADCCADHYCNDTFNLCVATAGKCGKEKAGCKSFADCCAGYVGLVMFIL
ncbi:hypothetical protein DdX_14357 [Ditylenchus destructor]|uniref:Uncharacterized protein n=1 Tax=Ditylenchus destructor TaxID=166010 RepID=A0AAD4MRX4_9BILA|nr:hypothetical protein DdX_14357 [Ditylenchus destructor]